MEYLFVNAETAILRMTITGQLKLIDKVAWLVFNSTFSTNRLYRAIGLQV